MTPDAFRDRYGPVALVTGASSGIGKAFAEELAERRFDLVIVARRRARLDELAAQLTKAHGVKVKVLELDLATAAAPQAMLDATKDLDVGLVISNAGFGMKGEHANNDPKAMTDMLMVNCNVAMQLAHGFIPRLRKRKKGGIVFTSSVEAMIGCPYSGAYSASKALVNALGEAIWAELKPEDIDVLTLCPGATESEAAGKQGIDIKKLKNVMPARDCVRVTLENIQNGPIFFSSEHYRAQMAPLLAMPKAAALMAMAQGMKAQGGH